MTPREAVHIARLVYSAPPLVGVEETAGRAVLYPGGALAFPGSNNFACWLADLDALAISVPGFGRLHAGFWEAWLSIRDPILKMDGITATIGHSEGAALALLAAANLAAVGKAPQAVFAFEPPRISTDGEISALLAAHKVDVRLYRNGFDVVPIVPRLLESWRHPAPLIQIGKPAFPFPNVDDHLIDNVVRAIEQMPA